jgi:hypothetical protein
MGCLFYPPETHCFEIVLKLPSRVLAFLEGKRRFGDLHVSVGSRPNGQDLGDHQPASAPDEVHQMANGLAAYTHATAFLMEQ